MLIDRITHFTERNGITWLLTKNKSSARLLDEIVEGGHIVWRSIVQCTSGMILDWVTDKYVKSSKKYLHFWLKLRCGRFKGQNIKAGRK
jgi:hypothetical protein